MGGPFVEIPGIEDPRDAARSELTGTEIDFSGDEFKYKTLTANTTLTIINPKLGAMVVLEVDGVFTLTLPATVNIINGDYTPGIGVNFLYIICSNEAGPEYQASYTVTV